MLSNLEIKNFRGLEHVQFEGLGKANLIVGGNNTGKTSILEALVMLYGNKLQLSDLPSTFRRLPKNERDAVPSFWTMLAKDRSPNAFLVSDGRRMLKLNTKQNRWSFIRSSAGNESVVATIDGSNFSANSSITGFPISVLSTKQADPAEVSELFNQIAPLNPDNEARLESLLRNSIEPRLRRLRYAKPQGTTTHLVYADIGEGSMLPFTQLGQAFSRTLQVYCEIFANHPKVILVDEIENGLYYEGLSDFWTGLLEVLEEQDIQLFATTHSRECMEAAHRAAKGRDEYPLRYLRLDRRIDDPSRIVGTTFACEEMETAINSSFEMR